MERCLNDELLQGPDLTNLLVGVLILFPKGQVAFMGDIEAMFHQVYIPESQRSFMQFLWWPVGDVYRGVEDYEMCVHSFVATSSGGCANSSLRHQKTESDNLVQKLQEQCSGIFIWTIYLNQLTTLIELKI